MARKQAPKYSDDAWELGDLGASREHTKKATKELATQVDDVLGLQMISIRLDKSLIDSFKLLADFHGVGYQPLMRDALKRFAEAEMKAIVSGVVESQKKKTAEKQEPPPSGQQQKAA